MQKTNNNQRTKAQTFTNEITDTKDKHPQWLLPQSSIYLIRNDEQRWKDSLPGGGMLLFRNLPSMFTYSNRKGLFSSTFRAALIKDERFSNNIPLITRSRKAS